MWEQKRDIHELIVATLTIARTVHKANPFKDFWVEGKPAQCVLSMFQALLPQKQDFKNKFSEGDYVQ